MREGERNTSKQTRGNLYKRHPLSFMMEAADSICYLIMDIEDGFNKKYYSYDTVKSELSQIKMVAEEFKKLEIKFTGRGNELARMVNLRIFLIRTLVNLAFSNFKKHHDAICAGDYHKELIHDDPLKLQESLSKFCAKHIFPHREVSSLELTGHSVLSGGDL